MRFTSGICSLLVLLGMLGRDDAFPQGANEISCAQLIPGHGNEVKHEKPYNLIVNRLTVYPGDTVKVTIEGTKDFRGFLVKTVDTKNGNTIGFSIPGMNMVDRCAKSGVTHMDGRVTKKRKTFDWVAPLNANPGTIIQFRSVIVEDKTRYYKVNSANVVIVSRPTTQTPTTPKPHLPVGGFTFGISNQRQAQNPPPSRETKTQQEFIPREITGTDGSPLTAEQRQKEITRNASKSITPLGLSLDPGCGRTRGCFHDCQGGRCTYIVTWVDAGDVITFDMKKIEPARSERWMAIAFSEDRMMGDDAVTECVIDAGVVRVYSSYNDDKTNKRMEDKTAGLSNAAGSYVNGVLECSFDHVKKDEFYPHLKDLNHDLYLMFADGDAISGSIFPHRYDVLPPVTDVPVDLQSMESVGGEGPRFPLVLAHGCIMIMCWVLLPGIGIVTARYGKPLLPKTHFFGLKIWFQIHRGCMITSVCMTILAALIVVVESEGYSKIPRIPGKQYQQLHPPLGIIVIILAIANPIMALFRPGPESVGRQLFNWAHWGVGVVSVVLAIVTIFIGLDLTKAGSSKAPMTVMTVYVVYLAAYLVAMELLPTVLKTLAVKQTKFELSANLNLRRGSHKGYDVTTPPPTAPVAVITQPPPTIEQENRVKTIMLLVHYVITGLLSVVMVILLATHPR